MIKKILSTSLTFMLLGLINPVLSEDQNLSNIDWGNIEGRLRLYHVFSPSYIKTGKPTDYDIDGSTIGGHIRYNTPKFSGFGASTALYFATGTGLNDTDDPNTIVAAGRFFTSDYSAKAVLGELNMHYKSTTNKVTAGYFKIDTPLTNAIYTYMPNMYLAAQYDNSYFDDTTISLIQIEKMAYGTRSPVEFGLIGEVTYTGGTTQNGLETRGEFINIEEQTLADPNAKTDGITSLGIVNKSLPHTTLRAWDFYAHDIINMFYTDIIYKPKEAPYSISMQYLRNDSVGDNLAAKWLDSTSAYLFGTKITYTLDKALFSLSYNHSGDARILNPWSGDPAYTSSFFSKNAYRANVNAYKLGFNYDILENLKLITSHADYGKSTTLGKFAPAEDPAEPLKAPQNNAFESAILLSYKPIESLQILGGIIYKTSEYYVADDKVRILDIDLLITYTF